MARRTADGGGGGGLDASRVLVPDWMRDEENAANPFASLAVRTAHVVMACKQEYQPADVLALAAENSQLDPRVDALLRRPAPPLQMPGTRAEDLPLDAIGEAHMEAPLELRHDAHLKQTVVDGELREERLSADERESRGERKVAFSTELWLGLAARTANQHVRPFLIICLSMLALQSGMSEDMWSALRFMLVLTSKQWITNFASDVASGLRTAILNDEDVYDWVRFVVGDNCDYHTRNVHEHTDRSGEYVHTVNWVSVPIRRSVVGLLQKLPHGGWLKPNFDRLSVRSRFDPEHADFTSLKRASWQGFMEQASDGDNILDHPDGAKPTRTEAIFEEPILDAGTAAYKDVDKFLFAVRSMYLFLVGMASVPRKMASAAVVMVVGDQQTFSRMLWLKLYHPARYARLLPLPGEFHFTVHCLEAIHKLWWPSLTCWVVHKFDCHKTIRQEWTSVEQYKYYDHFYQMLIRTLAEHLASTVPAPMLRQPELLLRTVRHNPAAVRAIRFLFEFGFPWLALRQAIRGNKSKIIDVMWRMTYHWFSVTGKTNYRIMCVIVTFIACAMVPELAVIWTIMRTASLSGYVGRNVGWDFVVERFNRMCKQALGTNVTRERLCFYVPILNAFRHVWPRFLRAMGRGDGEPSDYSHITPGTCTHDAVPPMPRLLSACGIYACVCVCR
jgi:hypothetical protein